MGMTKRKVIIRRCDAYDQETLKRLIGEGMEALAMRPRGRVLIKPNVVTANKEYIHHSYTEPRMVEAMVTVLKNHGGAETITIGESGGIGIPSRMFFAESGMAEAAKRAGVPLVDFSEEKTFKRSLEKAKWHTTMEVARSIHEADFKVWMPKLKYHIVTDLTNALKLNVGILTHKERFHYHDDRLHEKIVDLLEVGMPDLVVTDAVIIGKGFESSPWPVPLGALLISNDPLAVDVVASHILGYDPEEVKHLKEASDRGYGSLSISDVDVSGDVTVEELAARLKGVVSPFQDLQELDTPIRFYEGINPASGNICDGGCICSIKGVLGTSEKKNEGSMKKAKPGAIVMGHYQGDVVHPGETVALIGKCAGVSGTFQAGKVVKIGGCPATVKDLMLFMLHHFRIKSPALDPRNMALLIWYSLVHAIMKRVRPLLRPR